MTPRSAAAGLLVLLASGVFVGCRPSSVGDAEAKGDAAWLDTNGTPQAVAALGRLADKNPRALELMRARTFDVNAYIAAWSATKRGATWGAEILRKGLADPARADSAASAMQRKDPQLAAFVPDLEAALSRLAAGSHGSTLGSILASVGPPAHAAVERRMKDGASRGAMCAGIASPDSSADARAVLLSVPSESRDNSACVSAVMALVQDDDTALAWLGSKGEPGLLGAVSKNAQIPCARLHLLWLRAIGERAPATYHGLEVALSHAVKRGAGALDGVLADTLNHAPATHGLITAAIDPYGQETPELKATCAVLPTVAASSGTPKARERARDTILHGCRGNP